MGYFDHGTPLRAILIPAEAKIANQILELLKHTEIDFVIVLAELDQQDSFRRFAIEFFKGRHKDRDLPCKLDHGAVDEFDRDRLEPHDVLRGAHRRAEASEMACADRTAAEKGRQLSFDARRTRERC